MLCIYIYIQKVCTNTQENGPTIVQDGYDHTRKRNDHWSRFLRAQTLCTDHISVANASSVQSTRCYSLLDQVMGSLNRISRWRDLSLFLHDNRSCILSSGLQSRSCVLHPPKSNRCFLHFSVERSGSCYIYIYCSYKRIAYINTYLLSLMNYFIFDSNPFHRFDLSWLNLLRITRNTSAWSDKK